MGRQASISSRKQYGLARVCRVWEVARSSVYAWRERSQRRASQSRRRPGPQGPCSDGKLVADVRKALKESPFHGEGYRKVWARLRFKGIRTSKERVRRLMREHGLQAPHRVGRPRGPAAHDGTITTERPNEMWGTDMTATVTIEEGQAAVMVAVDHCSFECVGLHAAKSGNRFEALEPVRKGVKERLRGVRPRGSSGTGSQTRPWDGVSFGCVPGGARIPGIYISITLKSVREPVRFWTIFRPTLSTS